MITQLWAVNGVMWLIAFGLTIKGLWKLLIGLRLLTLAKRHTIRAKSHKIKMDLGQEERIGYIAQIEATRDIALAAAFFALASIFVSGSAIVITIFSS